MKLSMDMKMRLSEWREWQGTGEHRQPTVIQGDVKGKLGTSKFDNQVGHEHALIMVKKNGVCGRRRAGRGVAAEGGVVGAVPCGARAAV